MLVPWSLLSGSCCHNKNNPGTALHVYIKRYTQCEFCCVYMLNFTISFSIVPLSSWWHVYLIMYLSFSLSSSLSLFPLLLHWSLLFCVYCILAPADFHHIFNSLRPSDAIWRQRTESTLANVMACCLMAPSHYLNQCWLIISEVLWYSPEGNFTWNAQDIYPWCEFENNWFKITSTSPRDQWVKDHSTVIITCVN